jgi:hypothetical protein
MSRIHVTAKPHGEMTVDGLVWPLLDVTTSEKASSRTTRSRRRGQAVLRLGAKESAG